MVAKLWLVTCFNHLNETIFARHKSLDTWAFPRLVLDVVISFTTVQLHRVTIPSVVSVALGVAVIFFGQLYTINSPILIRSLECALAEVCVDPIFSVSGNTEDEEDLSECLLSLGF